MIFSKKNEYDMFLTKGEIAKMISSRILDDKKLYYRTDKGVKSASIDTIVWLILDHLKLKIVDHPQETTLEDK